MYLSKRGVETDRLISHENGGFYYAGFDKEMPGSRGD
jgi:hypothetical protein